MARCTRCNACESMWEFKDCPHCNFPHKDSRTPEQVTEDDKDYDEWIKEIECRGDDE